MRRVVCVLLIAALAGPALAGQTVSLKNDVTAQGPVTLGDLFEGAGAASGVVIAPAVTSGALTIDAAIVQQAASRAGLVWTNEQGVRRVVVHSGVSGSAAGMVGAAGPAAAKPGAMVSVLAYVRNLDAGEVVQAEDLTWAKAVAAPAGAPRDADQLIGKQAKRPLREGGLASARDVTGATVIKKDDMVSVIFEDDGVSVSMQGKALGSAAVGDAVGVLNPSTKKVVQAIASGPDTAVVGPAAERLHGQALTSSPQIALR
jgi:flagella basal body P-ring formation protein FlgA